MKNVDRLSSFSCVPTIIVTMGTRELIVLLFKGCYYQIYNSYDSYFSGLGDWLVQEILKYGTMETWRKLLALTHYVPNSEGQECPCFHVTDGEAFKELVDTLPETKDEPNNLTRRLQIRTFSLPLTSFALSISLTLIATSSLRRTNQMTSFLSLRLVNG